MMKIKNFQHAKNLRFLSMNKKGFIVSGADFFKGLVLGLIIGAIVVFLVAKGIIKLPF